MELTCHPRTPAGPVRAITAQVSRAGGALRLAFALSGELARVRVPPWAPPRAGSELWRRTCFEAFVAVEGASAYHELNLAPSGEWTVLAFRGYRARAPLDAAPTPTMALRATPDRLELDAEVALDRLAAAYATAPLRLALATVVEETGGARSYWALHHPPGDPDFHHAAAFVVRLDAPARPR